MKTLLLISPLTDKKPNNYLPELKVQIHSKKIKKISQDLPQPPKSIINNFLSKISKI
jgi:hypothetical protein